MDAITKLNGTHIAPWKWIVGVIAALAVAPFFTMAMGFVIAFLAPCGLAALPIMGFTMAADRRPPEPELRPILRRVRRLAVT